MAAASAPAHAPAPLARRPCRLAPAAAVRCAPAPVFPGRLPPKQIGLFSALWPFRKLLIPLRCRSGHTVVTVVAVAAAVKEWHQQQLQLWGEHPPPVLQLQPLLLLLVNSFCLSERDNHFNPLTHPSNPAVHRCAVLMSPTLSPLARLRRLPCRIGNGAAGPGAAATVLWPPKPTYLRAGRRRPPQRGVRCN
jgi:hypothetical protein